MTEDEKLVALHARLIAEQRRLVLAAAEVDAAPANGAVRRIADLELVIVAVEAMMGKDET